MPSPSLSSPSYFHIIFTFTLFLYLVPQSCLFSNLLRWNCSNASCIYLVFPPTWIEISTKVLYGLHFPSKTDDENALLFHFKKIKFISKASYKCLLGAIPLRTFHAICLKQTTKTAQCNFYVFFFNLSTLARVTINVSSKLNYINARMASNKNSPKTHAVFNFNARV